MHVNIFIFLENRKLEWHRRPQDQLWLHVTWRRLSTLELPSTNHTHTSVFAHAHGHAQKIFRRRHVRPLSEKNNAQSGSRRTRAMLLIWRGLEGVTCVYGIRNGRHSNPMLPCQGMLMGESLPLLFYPSSNAIGNLRAFSRANLFLTVIC